MKESEQAGGTHQLESAERGTSEDTKRKRATCTHTLENASRGICEDTERERTSEGHSPPGDRIGSDK